MKEVHRRLRNLGIDTMNFEFFLRGLETTDSFDRARDEFNERHPGLISDEDAEAVRGYLIEEGVVDESGSADQERRAALYDEHHTEWLKMREEKEDRKKARSLRLI